MSPEVHQRLTAELLSCGHAPRDISVRDALTFFEHIVAPKLSED